MTMAPEEMMEYAESLVGSKPLTDVEFWYGVAEICERLDRLATPKDASDAPFRHAWGYIRRGEKVPPVSKLRAADHECRAGDTGWVRVRITLDPE